MGKLYCKSVFVINENDQKVYTTLYSISYLCFFTPLMISVYKTTIIILQKKNQPMHITYVHMLHIYQKGLTYMKS